jgi:mRNA (2'-O-methyladenosine-N6-)-methyltransferase
MSVSQGVQNNRFSGNRNVHPHMQQMMGPQMMMPSVAGMGAHQMGMGMGMDDTLMGGWNPMMAGTNHLGGMQAGNVSNMANGGMAMNNPGMGVNGGVLGLSGMPMQLIAQMVQGAGGFNQQGVPYNGWSGNEQGQLAMDGNWENEGMIGMNPGMMNGMNMANMNMGNMGMDGMGMGQQWNGPGNF